MAKIVSVSPPGSPAPGTIGVAVSSIVRVDDFAGAGPRPAKSKVTLADGTVLEAFESVADIANAANSGNA